MTTTPQDTAPPLSPATEFERRAQALLTRAEAKYGSVALLPSGHPDYDVLDYAINELAGFPRYIQMIRERLKEHHVLTFWGESTLTATELQAQEWAQHLITLRREVLAKGIQLGAPETF